MNLRLKTDIRPDDVSQIEAQGQFSSDIRTQVIRYNAALIENCIREGKWNKRILCGNCLSVFDANEKNADELINLKRGSSNISFPCKSTIEICSLTEKVMEMNEYNVGNCSNTVQQVLSTTNFNILYPKSKFNEHLRANDFNHKQSLVELIVQIYYKKKQIYISQCNTLAKHNKLLRKKLMKYVHFKGQ